MLVKMMSEVRGRSRRLFSMKGVSVLRMVFDRLLWLMLMCSELVVEVLF